MKRVSLCLLLCYLLIMVSFPIVQAEHIDFLQYQARCNYCFETLLKYFIGTTDIWSAKLVCSPGSEAEYIIGEYAKFGSQKASQFRFEDMRCTEFTSLGDNSFTCIISGKHVCSYYKTDDAVYPINYIVTFKVNDGEARISDLARIEAQSGLILEQQESSYDGISITKVDGKLYTGYALTIDDPSRVFVGVINQYFNGVGQGIPFFINKYNAIGGINANGFEDPNGYGTGGVPCGAVVSEGQSMRWANYIFTTVGLDEQNVMYVGNYTGDDALKFGFREAAAWGPALIVNGEVPTLNDKYGITAHTAIGQKSDLSIVMVVLDGRQSNSPGATLKDMQDVLSAMGVVTACNLDGGPSSVMYFGGKQVNGIGPISGSRNIPCAFLIRR